MTKPTKSVEQRLFEAYISGKGMRMTREEVESLLLHDDAVRVRVCNRAASDAGFPERGEDCISMATITWEGLGKASQ